MAKKTAWFDGSVKPVRHGLYQRRMPWGVVFAMFVTPGEWMLGSQYPWLAAAWPLTKDPKQARPWRGLVATPEVIRHALADYVEWRFAENVREFAKGGLDKRPDSC